MNSGTTGNTGFYNPNGTLKFPPPGTAHIHGQVYPPGVYYHCPPGYSCGGYQSFHLANEAFAPWEVVLTVVAALVLVATVILIVRRLRTS